MRGAATFNVTNPVVSVAGFAMTRMSERRYLRVSFWAGKPLAPLVIARLDRAIPADSGGLVGASNSGMTGRRILVQSGQNEN